MQYFLRVVIGLLAGTWQAGDCCGQGEDLHDDRRRIDGAILPLTWLTFLSVSVETSKA